MEKYISFDSHKRYTLAAVESKDGSGKRLTRIEHHKGAVKEFLKEFSPGGAVAVETIGNWYWIIDEIEQAGQRPL